MAPEVPGNRSESLESQYESLSQQEIDREKAELRELREGVEKGKTPEKQGFLDRVRAKRAERRANKERAQLDASEKSERPTKAEEGRGSEYIAGPSSLNWEPVDKSQYKTPPGEKGIAKGGISNEEYLARLTKEAYGDEHPSPSEFVVYQNRPGDARFSRHGMFDVNGKQMEIHEEDEGEFDELKDHTKGSGRGSMFSEANRDNLYRSEEAKKAEREANADRQKKAKEVKVGATKKIDIYAGNDVLEGVDSDADELTKAVNKANAKKKAEQATGDALDAAAEVRLAKAQSAGSGDVKLDRATEIAAAGVEGSANEALPETLVSDDKPTSNVSRKVAKRSQRNSRKASVVASPKGAQEPGNEEDRVENDRMRASYDRAFNHYESILPEDRHPDQTEFKLIIKDVLDANKNPDGTNKLTGNSSLREWREAFENAGLSDSEMSALGMPSWQEIEEREIDEIDEVPAS